MLWYQLNKNQIANELETSLERGLSQAEAKRRLQAFGLNQLPEKKPESLLVVFLRQFKSPLVYILLVCSAIIFYLKEWRDSIIILVVLLFNAAIGAIQEGRSRNTLQSLKKLSFAETTVIRDGEEIVIPEHEVVPGDLVVLQEGQKVTADARVVFSSNLSVDESMLTGETGGIVKKEGALSGHNLPPASQENMIFKGTNVVAGNGRAIVAATGMNTEIGKISKALLQPEVEIPLQKNIRRLSQFLIVAIIAISAALFVLGLLSGRTVEEMFAVVVSLAVSIIPEGLPLVLTLILVTGVWRMSKRNALVKKLQAVEALGHADVLAVDKTGTLTFNEMVIKQVYLDSRNYGVTGKGYEPVGSIVLNKQPVAQNAGLVVAATVGHLVSRSSVMFSEKEDKFKVSGDPTEAAMVVFAEKLKISRSTLLEKYREVSEVPFNSKNKYHAIVYENGNTLFCAVAGAPEVLIKEAGSLYENNAQRPMSAGDRKRLETMQEEFSKKGLRVVAFGYMNLSKDSVVEGISGLVLAGLFAIEDQIRPEAAAAVMEARNAGVRTVMITGDNKITARAIGEQANIFQDGDEIVTGPEVEAMTEHELAAKLHKVSIFARVTPEDKMKIIKAYRHANLVVAMTGDGVNDAPSLVAADLGVAMGKGGTEVAKEAADIILLDDNLKSIVAAVEEGRAMYKNIQKALLFLFATSLGELLTIVLALFLHMPMPLAAVQILWLNLVTDPLIGMALALDPKEPGLLNQRFKRFPKYFIDGTMLVQMLLISTVMSVGTLWLFKQYYAVDYGKSITISLTLLAVFQWYNGFSCRSSRFSIFSPGMMFRNSYLWLAILGNIGLQLLAIYHPFMQKILKTTPLSAEEWLVIIAIGASIVVVEELRKFLYFVFGKRTRPTRPAPKKIPATRPM